MAKPAEQPALPRRVRKAPPVTGTTEPAPTVTGGDEVLLDRIRTALHAMR